MRLGNTPTNCRKCYVHPEIVCGYLEDDVVNILAETNEGELARRLSELSATLAL